MLAVLSVLIALSCMGIIFWPHPPIVFYQKTSESQNINGMYRIAGNFCRCNILWKCCIRFRRNFGGLYFHVSRTQQWPCLWWSRFSAKSLHQWKIDPVANFPWARHFFAKSSGPAIPVGLVAFHHCLSRKPRRRSPLFTLCIYTRHVSCPSCSGASTRQRSTEILK